MKRKSNVDLVKDDWCGENYRSKIMVAWLTIILASLLIGAIIGFLVGRVTAPETLIIIKDLPAVRLP